MTKIAGSGSISQRHGSEAPDPDPHQNVMDPQHWKQGTVEGNGTLNVFNLDPTYENCIIYTLKLKDSI